VIPRPSLKRGDRTEERRGKESGEVASRLSEGEAVDAPFNNVYHAIYRVAPKK